MKTSSLKNCERGKLGHEAVLKFGEGDTLWEGTLFSSEQWAAVPGKLTCLSLKGRHFQRFPLSLTGSSRPGRQAFQATDDVQGETGCQVGNRREEQGITHQERPDRALKLPSNIRDVCGGVCTRHRLQFKMPPSTVAAQAILATLIRDRDCLGHD